MSKILGLDLGTNSIGWAVLEQKNEIFKFYEKNAHLTKGVIIFPEGVKIEEKTASEKSRARERTEFRGARRLKFRRKLRKYETLLVLEQNNMSPVTIEEIKLWRKSGFKKYPKNEEFLKWLQTDNFGEKNNIEHKAIRKEQKENPYFYRDKLSRQKYEWEFNKNIRFELGRALYHLAQRRGFKSNRLEQSDENIITDIKEQIQDALEEADNSVKFSNLLYEIFSDYNFEKRMKDELDATEQNLKKIKNYISMVLENKIKSKNYSKFEDAKNEINRYINRPENLGTVKGSIKELSEKLENGGFNTLGQYFWHLYQNDRNDKENKIRTNYTDREEHYEKEFEIICSKQQFNEKLQKDLYNAIFYQRKLKSQKGLVGKCTFEKDKPRCPVSRPEFEEFRMWSFLNNIKIKIPGDKQLRPLTQTEKEKIIPKFYRQKKTFKFEEIADTLNHTSKFVYYKDRKSKNADYLINYKLNTTINGCPVSASIKKILGDDWRTNVFKNNKNGIPILCYDIAWHVLFTFDKKDKLIDFGIQKLNMNEISAKKFSKISLKQSYANLSLKAINKILPWLRQGLIYSHAVFMANIDKVVNEKIWANLDKRKEIEKAFANIIESHIDETRKINAINSLIKKYKNNESNNYKEPEMQNDLAEKFKEIFGPKSWKEKSDNETYLDESLDLLIKQIKNDTFAKVKRIDDRIIEFLLVNNFVSDDKRLLYLYHPSDLEIFKPIKAVDKDKKPIIVDGKDLEILPLPKTNAIKNPVLMRSMYQLRRLINELLLTGIIDNKTRVHIELAREVNDANKRAALKTWQDKLRDENEEIEKILIELFTEMGKKDKVMEDDIQKVKVWSENLKDKNSKYIDIFELTNNKKEFIEKYKLWKEQKGTCIYTGKTIALKPLFDGTSFDIEHTIPRSRSWDNSLMNKTVSDAIFNRTIKKSKIPSELNQNNYDDILMRINHWKELYENLDDKIKAINAANISDILIKNKMIQKRHILTFERDYWKGKYERFIMEEVPEGFKNSQITDTGLITRFAREYLSCLFRNANDNSNVYVVNGTAVDQFRKAWGLQEEYKKKSRANHIHHCIDATTIACMTKTKYDAFAEKWRKEEDNYQKYGIINKIEIDKPWKRFTEDIKKIEKEILIVHYFKDKISIQSKKKLRKRGKIQYKDKEKKHAKYQQGDTARGSLHQDTIYGAINHKGKIIYVNRPRGTIENLLNDDLKKIIDPKVREIVINGRKKEKELKDNLEKIKKEKENASEPLSVELNKQIKEIQNQIENEIYVIPPKKGKSLSTPIRNARIKALLSEPLHDFKQHRDIQKNHDGSEKFPYKKWIYVQNDSNYCLAIYENDDRTERAAEIIKLIDAAHYYKLSNSKYRTENKIIEKEKKGMKLKGFLKPRTLVLFYEDNQDEIWYLDYEKLRNRLYYVRKTSKDGRVTFQFHQEARNDKRLKEDYKKEHKEEEPPKSLTDGVSKIDFNILPIPKLLISPLNMKLLIEGIDFKINITGEIIKLN